ncbi:MAG: hypothetical protein PVH30_07145 [Desulfobacterales bacterium]
MTALPIEKFASICKRISLNLPSNARWAWDERFNLALVVFEEKDYDLVHMPIILEFEHRWDYFSLPGAFDLLKDHAVNAFGLIPGQEIFTATGTTGDGTFLFATLWPWGDGNRFSLRVGIISPLLDLETTRCHLVDWLKISN